MPSLNPQKRVPVSSVLFSKIFIGDVLMKDFIFISDFDGTMTEKDFYWIIIEKYLPEEGIKLYRRWRNNEIMDVEFLGAVFRSINRDENQILEDILNIRLDPYIPNFISNIRQRGGDFVILSAGTSYYIERLLAYHGIKDVKIISNPGYYKNRGIHMTADKNSPFYSERYGIAKELAVEKYKEEYKRVFFAWDSGPDLKAALCAHAAYARGSLADMLEKLGEPYYPFADFRDIEKHLFEKLL